MNNKYTIKEQRWDDAVRRDKDKRKEKIRRKKRHRNKVRRTLDKLITEVNKVTT